MADSSLEYLLNSSDPIDWFSAFRRICAMRSLDSMPESLREKACLLAVDTSDSDDNELRAAAISALGKVGDESVVPTLRSALDDESLDVCWAAAICLRRFLKVESVQILVEMLGHELHEVRYEAVKALSGLEGNLAVRGDLSVIDALRPFTNSPQREIKAAATSAIREIEAKVFGQAGRRCAQRPVAGTTETGPSNASRDQQELLEAEDLFDKGEFGASFDRLMSQWEDLGYSDAIRFSTLYSRLIQRGRLIKLRSVVELGSHEESADARGLVGVRTNQDGRIALALAKDRVSRLGATTVLSTVDFESGEVLDMRPDSDPKGGWYFVDGDISDDGRIVLAAKTSWNGSKQLIQVWDLDLKACVREISTDRHLGSLFSKVSISGDGTIGFTASPGPLTLWDLQSGQPVNKLDLAHNPRGFGQLSRDGRRIVSCNPDLTIWDRQSEATRHIPEVSGFPGALSGDGSIALIIKRRGFEAWNLNKELRIGQFGDDRAVVQLALSHDGRLAAVMVKGGELNFWHVPSGNPIGECQAPDDQPLFESSFAMSDDGQIAYSLRTREKLARWRLLWNIEFAEE